MEGEGNFGALELGYIRYSITSYFAKNEHIDRGDERCEETTYYSKEKEGEWCLTNGGRGDCFHMIKQYLPCKGTTFPSLLIIFE